MGSNDSREPELTEILADTQEEARAGTLVCKPARVESYDHNTRKASVSPIIKEWRYNEDDAKVEEALPVIVNVPVCFPSAGGLSVTFPIPKGATGVIIFSDVGLDTWLAVGGAVSAGSERRHALSDAIFIPGVFPFNSGKGGANGTAVEIGTDGGAMQGVPPGDDLKTYLDGHTHAVDVPPGGGKMLTSPPTTNPAGLPLDPSPTPSTTVKASYP